jgi:hypothetical protein
MAKTNFALIAPLGDTMMKELEYDFCRSGGFVFDYVVNNRICNEAR